MSLHRLPYFVAVAEHGSFTAAARALHMAQPPLSNQIHALERELGVELFQRTPRGATLTAAGRALLPEARLLLERFSQATDLVRRIGRGEAGRLAVGLVPTAANGELPQFLRRFMAEYPDVELTLTEQRPAALVEQLRAGTLDLVVQYQAVDSDELASVHVATERLLLAAPSGHALAARPAASVRDLAGMPLILPAAHGSGGIHGRLVQLLRDHDVEPRVVQADIWLMQTIVGLVSAGVGLAIVPESASVIRADQVTYLPLVEPGATVELYVNYRAGHREAPVRHFLRLMTGTS
ncbi:MAG: LysR family transcriptional regulator [Frankia sp.]|nr:LysR family transcriptional regulator [Frankia sp.]